MLASQHLCVRQSLIMTFKILAFAACYSLVNILPTVVGRMTWLYLLQLCCLQIPPARFSNRTKQMVLKYRLNLKLSWKEKGVKKKLHCRPHLQRQDQEIGTINSKIIVKVFFLSCPGPCCSNVRQQP